MRGTRRSTDKINPIGHAFYLLGVVFALVISLKKDRKDVLDMIFIIDPTGSRTAGTVQA